MESFGETVNDPLRSWLSLPIKKGGTSIPDPEAVSKTNFYASSHECSHLIEVLVKVSKFNVVTHGNHMSKIRNWMKMEKLKAANDWIDEHCNEANKETVRTIKYLKEDEVGTWLAAMPSFVCGTTLSPTEFRDEIHSRYGFRVINTETHCGGCGAKFTSSHALSCKVGGLIYMRHDESRDAIGILASQGFTPLNVHDEHIINPIRVKEEGGILTGKKQKFVSECSDEDDVKSIDKGDRGDLLIRGFYEKGTNLIMDFRIYDLNQPSYQIRKPSAILKWAETAKKNYLNACLDQRRHVCPFVVSCEGMIGREANIFMKRLSMRLVKKWKQPYSQTVSFVRIRFPIALVRAKNRYIRGSRVLTKRISNKIDWEV